MSSVGAFDVQRCATTARSKNTYDKSGGREAERKRVFCQKERQSKSRTPRAHLHSSPTHTISQPSSYMGPSSDSGSLLTPMSS